jgi:hypothetical protein
MAQDFAKSRNSAGKAGKKKPARAATRSTSAESGHWSWFFSGLFSGFLLCVVGYFALTQFGGSTPLVEELSGNTPDSERSSGTDLQFYEYLPQAEVEVNIVPVEIASAGVPDEADTTTYLLQAASFLDPNDAEALRARLILMNLEARIQDTNISGRTWYRVQAGPFTGRARMEAAENTLRQNNIDPIRMRIPGQ